MNKCKRYHQRFSSGYGISSYRVTSSDNYRRVWVALSPEMRSDTIDVTATVLGGGTFTKEMSTKNAFSVQRNQGNQTDWVRLASWIADAEL